MKVLLSIKPQFVEKILNGTKKYEFRKTLYKRRDITTVVVYASSPVQRVVCEFNVDGFLTEGVEELWEKTKDEAGISKEFYKSYFYGKEKACAIQIGKLKRFKRAKTLADYNVKQAPQSWRYIE